MPLYLTTCRLEAGKLHPPVIFPVQIHPGNSIPQSLCRHLESALHDFISFMVLLAEVVHFMALLFSYMAVTMTGRLTSAHNDIVST